MCMYMFGFPVSCIGDKGKDNVALEINPLHAMESCGLSSRSRTKAVGFVLSARVSDFWWHAGTHARSMVYLIKITPTPY